MKILRQRNTVNVVNYVMIYDLKGKENHGFAFSCRKSGELITNPNHPSLLYCKEHADLFEEPRIEENEHSYVEPAIGVCNVCADEVVLDGFTCTCEKCGTDYNGSGQQLADRSQWGWECNEGQGDPS